MFPEGNYAGNCVFCLAKGGMGEETAFPSSGSVKLVIGQVISIRAVPSEVRTFAIIKSGMENRCKK